ncbi:galactose-binding domain-like protein [Parasitella parasitica]|nr:galactose-binding domain-like protein [Parasitella parasitica]
MSHCHDEHCEHDHDDLPESGEQFLLYSKIDLDNVRCLNESELDSGKSVIRPWNQRLEDSKFVESDVDEQLIFFIPFTGSVKLRSICLRTDPSDSAPSKMKVFINRNDVDFDVADSYTPIQEFELVEGSNEVVEYGTKITKFSSVTSITLFFPENFGQDDTSIVRFIGFKGEWTEVGLLSLMSIYAFIHIFYEANANPADHKIPGAENKMNHSIQ